MWGPTCWSPRYVGNFFLSLGVCVALNACLRLTLPLYMALYSVQYYFIVRLEEMTLERKFGEAYAQYRAVVPRFIPRLSAYARPSDIAFNGNVAFANERKTFTSIIVIGLLAVAIHSLHQTPVAWIKSLLSA